MQSHLLLIEAIINNYAIYLSSIEIISNSWKRYLLLSETTEDLRHRCAPLSGTIGGLGYMCARVGAYCIRPSIIPNENRQSFGDSLFIHSSLTGCLWGVCFCAPTRVHAFDRWMVGTFLRRGVLHTPLDHAQRKRAIIRGFMGYTIIPCGMIMGRMQYAPTRVHVFYRWVVRVFLGRGVFKG